MLAHLKKLSTESIIYLFLHSSCTDIPVATITTGFLAEFCWIMQIYNIFFVRQSLIYFFLHSSCTNIPVATITTSFLAEFWQQCNQCDCASSQASHLRTRLKTHSGEKSNKCTNIPVASITTGSLVEFWQHCIHRTEDCHHEGMFMRIPCKYIKKYDLCTIMHAYKLRNLQNEECQAG